jgi:hypothetical protein
MAPWTAVKKNVSAAEHKGGLLVNFWLSRSSMSMPASDTGCNDGTYLVSLAKALHV